MVFNVLIMLKIEMYDTRIKISFFKDEHSLQQQLIKIYKRFKVKEETEELCEGLVFFHPENSNEVYLYLTEKYLTFNLISHEMYHLTNRILSQKGLKLTIEDDEQHAILNGYLNEKLIKYIYKKGYTIK